MFRTAISSMLFAASLLTVSSALAAQTPPAANSPAAQTSSTPRVSTAPPPPASPEPAWVVRSNRYTQMLLKVQMKHSPESGSMQGMAQYDSSITNAARADELAQRKQLVSVLAHLKKAEAKEKDRNVRQDLEILQNAFSLQFRRDDYQYAHKVQFVDASQAVFIGLRTLLDDQVPPPRRPTALLRLRKYAGVEPGFQPFTEVLKQRMIEQMAKPDVEYPSSNQMEAQMAQDTHFIDDMHKLFLIYKLTGWEQPFDKLQQELADYNTWIRATVMPKAQTNLRPSPEESALELESNGIDLPSDQLATEAHTAFTAIQAEMAPLAVEVARQHGWASTDYRDVIRQMQKSQSTGDNTLPFYQARLKTIEDILVTKNLVTLPDRPAILRVATAAETAQQSAPRMIPPPFLHNTGQRGEFVLPLNAPSSSTGAADKNDDFNYDAVAWPTIAREIRPGRDLQFDSMLKHGMSEARLLYAYTPTNLEGWDLYSEWIMQPYEPAEGQLATLQLRLLRTAQAFLNLELQASKIKSDDACKMLENDVVLSHAFAKQEVDQFARSTPGEASRSFYSYTKMLQLRKDSDAALGAKFDAKRFHDFVLAQGLIPPDLLRKAVMEDFIPAQQKKK
jgi:uncharacterized protein (DUF885 family)